MNKFKFDTKLGIILCHAEISKHDDRPFVIKMALDTGATYTLIPFEAAMAAGINPVRAKKQIEIVMGGGIVMAPLIRVPSFKAFGYEVKNLEVICHNLPPESSVEGLLGLNFLIQFNVLLKFLEHSLEITK